MLLNYKSIDNFYSAADFVYIFKYMYNCITNLSHNRCYRSRYTYMCVLSGYVCVLYEFNLCMLHVVCRV